MASDSANTSVDSPIDEPPKVSSEEAEKKVESGNLSITPPNTPGIQSVTPHRSRKEKLVARRYTVG